MQLWDGLGLIVVEAERTPASAVRDDRFYELFHILRSTIELMARLESREERLGGLKGVEVERRLLDSNSNLGEAGDEPDEVNGELLALLAEPVCLLER